MLSDAATGPGHVRDMTITALVRCCGVQFSVACVHTKPYKEDPRALRELDKFDIVLGDLNTTW